MLVYEVLSDTPCSILSGCVNTLIASTFYPSTPLPPDSFLDVCCSSHKDDTYFFFLFLVKVLFYLQGEG